MDDQQDDQQLDRDLTPVNAFSALLLSATNSDIRILTWLMIGIFFLSEVILRDFRIWYYGHSFIHWTDWVIVAVLAGGYAYYYQLIGKLYLNDFYEELAELHPELQDEPIEHSDNTIKLSTNIVGIEQQVLALYMETGEEAEAIIASLAKVTGNVMLATATHEANVDFNDMKVHVTVEDLEK